jgi:probable F420-dependent oxidoreductase
MSSPHDRPFRFSVQASSLPSADPRSWAELARRTEDLGYTGLTVSDHLDDQLAPMPALMAAADATTTLRVGSLVLSNDYKHPAVVAKEAATLDVLSGGRLDLGIGAGWMPGDYERAGFTFDRPSVRIARLDEALTVIKGLFGPGPVTFSGEHYQVTGLEGTPKPIQRPRPPILVGGGSHRILTMAARQADVVGLNPSMHKGTIDASMGPDATAEATDEKIGWIREGAGERWSELSIQIRIHVVAITDDRTGLVAAAAEGFGLTPEQALASPYALCGTVDQIVEDLQARRERFGISSIGVGIGSLDDLAPVVARLVGT